MAIESRNIRMMGTIIQLTIQHHNPQMVLDEMVARLKTYEKRFSANDSHSELMEVNKCAGVKPVNVESSLYELIKIGKKHSIPDDSSLNIAIGPLVQAWKIGFKGANVPSEEKIQSLLPKTNPHNIMLDDQTQTVFLKEPDMFIDLGALAKGFIADLMIDDMKSMDVTAGLINLGGNVMTYGASPKQDDGYWRIGIQHPFLPRGNYISVIKAFNQSVVTSGIYERKFTMNNQTYHHILDRHTGYPIQTNIASLTVISKKSVDGEVWTGRLFGQPANQILSILNELQDVEGIIINKDGELSCTKTLKPYIT